MIKANKKTTRKILNLNTLTLFSARGYNQTDYVFYVLQPYNINVMSKDAVNLKVAQLAMVMKAIDSFDILTLNGRENFELNKEFIRERLQEEKEPAVINLLKKDYESYDEMQVKTATNRSFLLSLSIRMNKSFEIFPFLSRVEQSMLHAGFSVKRMNKDEIKEMLSIYLEQNLTTEKFEDVDGERWYKDEQ